MDCLDLLAVQGTLKSLLQHHSSKISISALSFLYDPTLTSIHDYWKNEEDPLEEGMATHSSILAVKSHGQRSLDGYSPWSCKELDMTEQLTTVQHMFLTVFGQIVLKKQSLQSLSSI